MLKKLFSNLFLSSHTQNKTEEKSSIAKPSIRLLFWSLSLSRKYGGPFVFIFVLFLLCGSSVFAQVKDTTLNANDPKIARPSDSINNNEAGEDSLTLAKVKQKNKQVYHSPKKSAIMSAILPGMGQVYNKKYWKVPIIYAGMGGLVYSINANQKKYSTYLEAYKFRIDADPSTIDNFPRYTDDNLNTLQQYYKRYRNLSVIGAALLYLMNVIDASVDAHMFTFDVGDDLSFHLQPTLLNTANVKHYTTGLSLKITF